MRRRKLRLYGSKALLKTSMRLLNIPFGSAYRLGPLEAELLRALWKRGEATVRDLLDQDANGSAYTTIMTTLDRLYKKGLLKRRKLGRAFAYTPAFSRAEFGAMLARHALQVMLSYGEPQPVLSHFVGTIGASDAGLLDELERAVRAHRRNGKK